ncbi:L-2-hydroxyglutarate oxidase [Desulfosoma caldarium]|uniref:2-hydroxyglutarate dehydrogenase/L-2-hydroxyglutarate oxidase n=1 Tax=Desulfosoma caldarium TaxID=610254 RepID=A0A3N1VTB1_9BACT|nr:L-2-hydroxyglutarate oxidase [Desulfosoma caldarium]ROR03077.1 2-hydroxyglutarate dehydrogenase/L-2-hydroxyglutarate oxidase [Desulfosoma caldarium]
MKKQDVIVIGAGIVGLATAYRLLERMPSLNVVVLEKEAKPGTHQTGHNSGVIHSGLYYRPGSLKASLCMEGARALVDFCRDHSIPFEICGKIVVATNSLEVKRLQELQRRGTANGVPDMAFLSPAEARNIEPHVRCLHALWVPTTGIVDFRQVAQKLAQEVEARGGRLLFAQPVVGMHQGRSTTVVVSSKGEFSTRLVINCAGLHADRVARLGGFTPPCRIVPFRGEYYSLHKARRHLVRSLIYPVPDPRFPFLGVHFTRRIDGSVEAGPNAVLAWAREGYTRTTVQRRDILETLTYPGFFKLARKYWKTGLQEMIRSVSKSLFAKALQKLVPDITAKDLAPGGAGVRAQALSSDGRLLDDFVIIAEAGQVHVLNAPSPAATSSLAIGDVVAAKALSFLR